MKDGKDLNRKTIRFSEAVNDKLCKLAEKFGREKLLFFSQMVDYFHKTGKDPADINDEVLKKTLLKNHDTYIRFIRAQEDNLLLPMKENVDRLITNQREIVRYFNEQVISANKAILQGQDAQAGKFGETEKILQAIHSRMESKEDLKRRFMHILNQYSKSRENTPAKEKEALLQAAQQQIIKL
jgi:predicted transcriptional regulator